jgi:hypothetical protein
MCARKPGARCETSIVEKQQSLLKKLEQVKEDIQTSSQVDSQQLSILRQEIVANTIDLYSTAKQQKLLQHKKDNTGLTYEEKTLYEIGAERKMWQSSVTKQLHKVKKQYSDEAEGVHAAKHAAEFMVNNLNWELQARTTRKKNFLQQQSLQPRNFESSHSKQQLDRLNKEITVTQMKISDLRFFIAESEKQFESLLSKT